jgi:hypothetical protein
MNLASVGGRRLRRERKREKSSTVQFLTLRPTERTAAAAAVAATSRARAGTQAG